MSKLSTNGKRGPDYRVLALGAVLLGLVTTACDQTYPITAGRYRSADGEIVRIVGSIDTHLETDPNRLSLPASDEGKAIPSNVQEFYFKVPASLERKYGQGGMNDGSWVLLPRKGEYLKSGGTQIMVSQGPGKITLLTLTGGVVGKEFTLIPPGSNVSSREHHLPKHLALVSNGPEGLFVKGAYYYSGRINSDGQTLLEDIWNIAQDFPESTSLNLAVSFAGKNQYGEDIQKPAGSIRIVNLAEVRRYKSAGLYSDSTDGKTTIAVFLGMESDSPYNRVR
jgi:hypothetical protein